MVSRVIPNVFIGVFLVAYCTDAQVRQKEGDDILKYQETALVKVGELYRDLKYVGHVHNPCMY